MGIIIAAIALFVFVGGISRIAKVTETIVPIMACFYIIGSLIVIFANFKEIPYAFYSIVVGAFKPSAVSGGAVGATVKLALTKVWQEDCSRMKQVWDRRSRNMR